MSLKDKMKNKDDKYVFGRSSIQEMQERLKKADSPKAMQGMIEYATSIPLGLSEEDQAHVDEQAAQLSERAAEAQSLYEKNKKSTEWAKIGELFGHALVKLAAAKKGLASGVDLTSGLKQQKSDWQSELNRLHRELQDSLSRVDRKESLLERKRANVLRRLESERARQIGIAGQAASETAAEEKEGKKKIEKDDIEIERGYLKSIQKAQDKFSKKDEARKQLVVSIKSVEDELEAEDTELTEEKAVGRIRKLIADKYLKAGFTNVPAVNDILDKAEDKGMWWWKKKGTPVWEQIQELPYYKPNKDDLERIEHIQNPKVKFSTKKGLWEELNEGEFLK